MVDPSQLLKHIPSWSPVPRGGLPRPIWLPEQASAGSLAEAQIRVSRAGQGRWERRQMAPRTWRSPCAASTGALGAAGKPAPGRTSPYGGLHWLFSGRGPWLGGGWIRVSEHHLEAWRKAVRACRASGRPITLAHTHPQLEPGTSGRPATGGANDSDSESRGRFKFRREELALSTAEGGSCKSQGIGELRPAFKG